MSQILDSKRNEMNVEEIKEKIKTNLDGWKQILVKLNKFFIWEEQYYAMILSAVVTVLFGIIWLINASVLTTVSMIGIICCLFDYFVPILCNSLFDSANWSPKCEEKYNEICRELSLTWLTTVNTWNTWQKLKETKPTAYFVSLLVTLLTLAWIGNLINNLFLTYLLTLFITLFPGLKHHGILDKYIGEVKRIINNTFGLNKEKQK